MPTPQRPAGQRGSASVWALQRVEPPPQRPAGQREWSSVWVTAAIQNHTNIHDMQKNTMCLEDFWTYDLMASALLHIRWSCVGYASDALSTCYRMRQLYTFGLVEFTSLVEFTKRRYNTCVGIRREVDAGSGSSHTISAGESVSFPGYSPALLLCRRQFDRRILKKRNIYIACQ